MARTPFLLSAISAFALFSCDGPGGSSIHEHSFDQIKISHDAHIRTYLVDSDFDSEGLEVSLHCSKCGEWVKTENYRIPDGIYLESGQESVTITAAGLSLKYPIAVKDKLRVACIGDSLTKGHSWPNESYPSLLSQKATESFEVGNFGENGISATGYGGAWNNPNMKYMKQHFYTDSIAFAPDVFVVILGSNDANQWDNAAPIYEQEYRTLIKSYIEEFPLARIVMMVSPPTAKGNAFGIPNDIIRDNVNPIQREIAEDYGCDIIDLREEFEATVEYETKYLRPNDGVHFTREAADYVASRVKETILG